MYQRIFEYDCVADFVGAVNSPADDIIIVICVFAIIIDEEEGEFHVCVDRIDRREGQDEWSAGGGTG